MSTVQALNVNHPDHRENLQEEKYVVVRDAILAALPDHDSGEGMTFPQLEDEVRRYLTDKGVPMSLFPKPGSIRWYTKTVQLDLEARALIERVPNRTPIHLRKVRSS